MQKLFLIAVLATLQACAPNLDELNKQPRPVSVVHDEFEGKTRIRINKDDLIRQTDLQYRNAIWSRNSLLESYTKFEIIADDDTNQASFVAYARIYSAEPLSILRAAFGSGDNEAKIKTMYQDVSCVSKCVTIHEVSFSVDEDFVSDVARGDEGKKIRLYTTRGHHDVGLNPTTVSNVYYEYRSRYPG